MHILCMDLVHVVATSGRVDRMFQVTPDQERTMQIGDMLSDGLLIVEFPPSPASTPAVEIVASLDTPVSAGMPGELPTFMLAAGKRNTFGRNASYGEDCCEYTETFTVEPLNNGHAWDPAFCPL